MPNGHSGISAVRISSTTDNIVSVAFVRETKRPAQDQKGKRAVDNSPNQKSRPAKLSMGILPSDIRLEQTLTDGFCFLPFLDMRQCHVRAAVRSRFC